MWSDLTDLFLPAFGETLAMVGVSGGIGALFGVPLGVLLYLTGRAACCRRRRSTASPG